MTKRAIALTYAKIAGYHDDSRAYTRLLVESRVNRQSMQESFLLGKQARLAGIACNCHECKKGAIIT